MTYETAKKLKDAGYEFTSIEQTEYRQSIENTDFRVPTLSELIEACGDRFGGLNRYPLAPVYERFECFSEWIFEIRKESNEHEFVVYGKTPEEAVANLYLALKSN